LHLQLRGDGLVDFQSATLSLAGLKPVLEEVAKTSPNQPLIIDGRERVSHAHLKRVVDVCRSANLTHITIAKAKIKPVTEVAASAPKPKPTPAVPVEAEPAVPAQAEPTAPAQASEPAPHPVTPIQAVGADGDTIP
jgi:hypothetical protein